MHKHTDDLPAVPSQASRHGVQVLHGKALGKRAWHGDYHRRDAAAGRGQSEGEGMAPKLRKKWETAKNKRRQENFL